MTLIEHCSKYDGSKNSPICVECENDFFIASTSCQERQNKTVQNCTVLRLDFDGCKKCAEGFELSNDFLKCFPQIEHCQKHNNESTSS